MKSSATFIAFVTALALHLIIGAVLLMGMDFSLSKDKPKEEVVIINASMVNQKLFDDLAKQKTQQKADKRAAEKRKVAEKRKEKERVKREKRLADKKRKDAEVKRVKAAKEKERKKQKEEERIQFEEIVAAKALRAKEEAEKTKKLAEEKFKKQETLRIEKEKAESKRVEAKKIADAKALKEKQQKEAKVKADKAAKEKAIADAKQKAIEKADRLRQAELDKQMEAEFEDSFSSAQSSKQLSEIARYKALIQGKISRNWQVDPSMKGKTCTLAIRLAPDGLVLSANRSKGDPKLCDSAKRAALKAKTLPIPKDPEIAPQFRDFDITLEPDF